MKLVLAGGSSYSDAYGRELRKHASSRIRLVDWVTGTDREELLLNALLLVLPSDLEGLSLALLEAMGAGVCVLASDIPENREVVDGVGFTFQHGSADDLARMLTLLLANPVARRAAADRARARVRDCYLWSHVAGQLDRTYQALARRGVDVPLVPPVSMPAKADPDTQRPAA